LVLAAAPAATVAARRTSMVSATASHCHKCGNHTVGEGERLFDLGGPQWPLYYQSS